MIKVQKYSLPHVIYHWWCDDLNIKPYEYKQSPIIASIASLRSHCPNVNITVLDASARFRDKRDWDHFPYLLNFKIEKCKSFIKKNHTNLVKKIYKNEAIWDLRLTSRIWDVEKYARKLEEKEILFLDSDVFCVSNPFPSLNKNHNSNNFVCDVGNTGVWFYKKNNTTDIFFDNWKENASRIVSGDKEFFTKVKKETNLDYLNDETIYRYMTKKNKKIRSILHPNFNLIVYFLSSKNYLNNHKIKFDTVKFLHACDNNTFKNKLLVGIQVCEIKNSIQNILSKYYCNLIFKNHDTKSLCLEEIFNMKSKNIELFFKQD